MTLGMTLGTVLFVIFYMYSDMLIDTVLLTHFSENGE